MPNLSEKKNSMPVQAPDERIRNFSEVALGYDEKTAVIEAQRCLNCRHQPCVNGCPVNERIPDFHQKSAAGEFEGA